VLSRARLSATSRDADTTATAFSSGIVLCLGANSCVSEARFWARSISSTG